MIGAQLAGIHFASGDGELLGELLVLLGVLNIYFQKGRALAGRLKFANHMPEHRRFASCGWSGANG
jgi:hypothetical protein